MYCINRKSQEYQTLLKRSGLPSSKLDIRIFEYMTKYGRFPYLDELNGVDSEKALVEEFKIKPNSLNKTDQILDNTSSDSIAEAQVKLNDMFRDKEVEITPIGNGDLVNIELRTRPNTKLENYSPKDTINSSISNVAFFSDAIYRLKNLYGLQFIGITDKELSTQEWLDKVPTGQSSKAFIYNGDIYLNLDSMSVDSPLHELLHIFFGSIKYTNNDLYNNLTEISENLPMYDKEVSKFPNRSRSDINEEILVQEVAKLASGEQSLLDELDESVLYEIKYNILRTIDSMISGKDSVKAITLGTAMSSSIRDLTNMLRSDKLDIPNTSAVSRILNNRKTELFKKKELTEECF